MKLFAMLPLPVQLGIALALVVGAFSGYELWHHSIYKEGAAAQKKLDDAVLAKRDERIGTLQATLSTSQGDLAQCQLAAGKQNEGIDELKKKTKEALAKSNTEKVKAQMQAAEHAQEVKRLQASAAAPPKVDQSAADALGLTDKILRDTAKERRK